VTDEKCSSPVSSCLYMRVYWDPVVIGGSGSSERLCWLSCARVFSGLFTTGPLPVMMHTPSSDKRSPNEVVPIVSRVGSGSRRRVGNAGVRFQECRVWFEILKKPPHGVCDPGGRCVRHPDVEGSQVLECRSQVHRFHAMIIPCAAMLRCVPGEDLCVEMSSSWTPSYAEISGSYS
jgi:hypothetical protein